jgi:hypothetical protein
MVSGGIVPPFFISAIGGSVWEPASRPGPPPGERASGTHWTGGWVGPRTSLDAVE